MLLDILAKLIEYVREQGAGLWFSRAHQRAGDMLDRGKEIGAIKDVSRFFLIDDAENAFRKRRAAHSATKGSHAQ